ncbi:MAG: hypothetical protein AAFO93_13420, partial [Pseudomonadota bacterium]
MALAAATYVMGALPAAAIDLSACARTTHISHAGEAGHRDLGEGRVAWGDWWAQEGTSTDIMVVECASGDAVRARVAEANMSSEPAFDKTDRAISAIEQVHSGARVFATLDRVAAALDRDARRIERVTLTSEPCACAALYPEARGDKPAFEFENLP